MAYFVKKQVFIYHSFSHITKRPSKLIFFQLPALGCLKNFLFHLCFWDFPWYRILGCRLFFSFQCLKDVVTLSFQLYPARNFLSSLSLFLYMKHAWLLLSFSLYYLFWTIYYVLCVFMQFSLCTLCLGFAELFGSVGLCFSLNLGKFGLYFFKYFSDSCSPLF